MHRLLAASFALTILLSTACSRGSEAREGSGPYDLNFLSLMSPHHQMAVDMSQPCLQKASHTELKALCQSIMQSQLAEKRLMDSWRSAWYPNQNADGHASMNMGQHKKMMDDLRDRTGNDYDQAFLKAMTQHHQEAVRDGRTCEERAEHAELREMCTKMVADQQREIDQMSQWMSTWR